MPVHVTLLPSLIEQLLSSNEINFDSVSKTVVASITATGRDLKERVLDRKRSAILENG